MDMTARLLLMPEAAMSRTNSVDISRENPLRIRVLTEAPQTTVLEDWKTLYAFRTREDHSGTVRQRWLGSLRPQTPIPSLG
jgi:hypothetical protein